MRHVSVSLATLLALCAAAFAAPAPQNAIPASLARDRHSGLTVAADAYSDAARAKEKLGKANPVPAGILPVEVFFVNETDQPMQISLSTVQLDVVLQRGRQDIDRLTPEQVAEIMVHPTGAKAPSAPRLPIPLGGGGGDSKVDKMTAEIRHVALDADIVPPMGTIHGFLFFNVDRHMDAAEHSNLYIPNVRVVATNQALIFFEVPLGKPQQP